MKRKGSQIVDEREPKRFKLNSEDLSVDSIREILKHVNDEELIYFSRVSKGWNKASIIERSRFIDQRINRLKWSCKHKTTDPKSLLNIVSSDIAAVRSELDRLTKFQSDLIAENAKDIPVIQRFNMWRDSVVQKTNFPYRANIDPEGETDFWDMRPFSADDEGSLKGRTYTLDEVLEYIEEHLDASSLDLESEEFILTRKILEGEIPEPEPKDDYEKEDDLMETEQCQKLMSLEKYLEVLMDLNFGSCVNDW